MEIFLYISSLSQNTKTLLIVLGVILLVFVLSRKFGGCSGFGNSNDDWDWDWDSDPDDD